MSITIPRKRGWPSWTRRNDFGTKDVHILNQRAKVRVRQGRDDEAVVLFGQALAGDGLDPVERAFSVGTVDQQHVQTNWHAAEQLFLVGASAADASLALRAWLRVESRCGIRS